MTEHFGEIFKSGGKANSLGRSREALEAVLADQARMDELFDCIFDDDAWVRMRAIDTFEKVCREYPEWVKPYLDRLFSEVATIDQPSIQWHLAEIFSEVELTPDERSKAIAIMKRNIATTDADWIVAANSMKALTQFVQKGYVPASDVVPLLNIQQQHHSKSVVKKATQLLEEIS